MKLLALLVGLMLVTSPARAENLEIRVATLAPAGTPWMDILEKAAAEIAEKTQGRVKIKYFPGGQLGDERDFIRKINLGQIDGAAISAVGLSMIEPSIRVLELPMLFETIDEVDYVAGKMWPYFQKKFEAKGYRLAERGEIGWIHLMSKSKIASLADLRKVKLCTVGADLMGSSVVDKLGLDGVALGVAEVGPALTSGRIDACLNSPLGAIALQWHTKVKFMSARPLVYAIGATVMSNDVVKKISAEDRASIDAIAKANQKKARAVIRKANEDSKKTLIKKGIQVVDVPDAMVQELTKLGTEVQAEMTGKLFSAEELAMVVKYRDELRAKAKK
jgi:TRAP-type C4-dicarboxylate transport system substrate-binding protein